MVAAFGRPLFLVHRDSCLGLVRSGVNMAILGALHGFKVLLGKKAPGALIALQSTTQAVRAVRDARQEHI